MAYAGRREPGYINKVVNTIKLTAVLFSLLMACLPAAAQTDVVTGVVTDIVGYWNQPAIGTALGPGIAANFGFEEDIRYCLTIDNHNVLPMYEDGRLVAKKM